MEYLKCLEYLEYLRFFKNIKKNLVNNFFLKIYIKFLRRTFYNFFKNDFLKKNFSFKKHYIVVKINRKLLEELFYIIFKHFVKIIKISKKIFFKKKL